MGQDSQSHIEKMPHSLEESQLANTSSVAVAENSSPVVNQGVSESRSGIEGALSTVGEANENTGEIVDMESEKVSESLSHGKERKSQGVKTSKPVIGDKGARGDDKSRVYTAENLPDQEEMMSMINSEIRKEIEKLNLELKNYNGGLFKSAQPIKVEQIMAEIRQLNLQQQSLISKGIEAIKNIFLTMFGEKKQSK